MSIPKVLGFLVAGVVVVAVGAVVLGMIASLLHVLIPVAVLCAIGFVAIKAYSLLSGSKTEEKKDEPKKLEEEKKSEAPAAANKAMSEAQALAEFEEHRKKLGP